MAKIRSDNNSIRGERKMNKRIYKLLLIVTTILLVSCFTHGAKYNDDEIVLKLGLRTIEICFPDKKNVYYIMCSENGRLMPGPPVNVIGKVDCIEMSDAPDVINFSTKMVYSYRIETSDKVYTGKFMLIDKKNPDIKRKIKYGSPDVDNIEIVLLPDDYENDNMNEYRK